MATNRRATGRPARRPRRPHQKSQEPTGNKEYDGWRKNFRFHLIMAIVFTALCLLMLALALMGVGDWITWTLMVIFGLVALDAAIIELPKPINRKG